MQIIALAIFSFIFVAVYIAVHFLFRKRNLVSKALISFVGTIAMIVLSIYACTPKNIAYSDPELAPLWKAIEAVDRAGMGFTPVSKDSKIKIERANRKYGRSYDVMLHIYNHTSRTIAFKKSEGVYYWIGEQEIFKGPNKYSSVDGTFHEDICITFHVERYSDGHPVNTLTVRYSGEDQRLMHRFNLTLADIQPILKEWGYIVQQSPGSDSLKAAPQE
jgi:hypothetical protein